MTKALKNSHELKLKLQKIVQMHETVHSFQSNCLKAYPLWSQKRKDSIRQLKKLAEKVETRKKNVNWPTIKFAGEAVSLIGDVISIVGAIKSATESVKSDTSMELMKAGQTGSLLGGAIAAGVYIDNKEAETVKCILQMDLQESSTLLKYRGMVKEFKDLVEEIMEFEGFFNVMDHLDALHLEFSDFGNRKSRKKFRYVLPLDIVEMIEDLPLPDTAKLDALKLISIVLQSHDCWYLFKDLISMGNRNAFALQTTFFIATLSLQSMNDFEGPSSFLKSTIPPAESDPVSHGVISTVAAVVDLMNITNTSEEISKEVPSKFPLYLKKCIKFMQDELDIWERAYHAKFQNDHKIWYQKNYTPCFVN